MNDDIPDSYEKQTGSVIRIEPGRFIVRVERDDSECGGCHSCAVRGLCRGRDTGHMDLPIAFTGEPPARAGEKVTIAYRASNAAVASFVMFLPALLGLFLGGFIGYRMGESGDGPLIIGCLSGFFGGFAVSWLLAKSIPALQPDVRFLSRA